MTTGERLVQLTGTTGTAWHLFGLLSSGGGVTLPKLYAQPDVLAVSCADAMSLVGRSVLAASTNVAASFQPASLTLQAVFARTGSLQALGAEASMFFGSHMPSIEFVATGRVAKKPAKRVHATKRKSIVKRG